VSLLPLVAALLALICGPLLHALASHQRSLMNALDGFVLVSVAGLMALDVLPEAWESGGWMTLPFLLLGTSGPSLIEAALHRARRKAHLATLAVAACGLILHRVADGVALGQEGARALSWAVVIHSLPASLLVWWLLAPLFGRLVPSLVLLMMGLATVVGWNAAGPLQTHMDSSAWAWFQALVAGSVLHVVFGRPHLAESDPGSPSRSSMEGLGNLIAVGLIVMIETGGGHHADEHQFSAAPLIGITVLLAPAVALALTLALFQQGALAETRARLGSLLTPQAMPLADSLVASAIVAVLISPVVAMGVLLALEWLRRHPVFSAGAAPPGRSMQAQLLAGLALILCLMQLPHSQSMSSRLLVAGIWIIVARLLACGPVIGAMAATAAVMLWELPAWIAAPLVIGSAGPALYVHGRSAWRAWAIHAGLAAALSGLTLLVAPLGQLPPAPPPVGWSAGAIIGSWLLLSLLRSGGRDLFSGLLPHRHTHDDDDHAHDAHEHDHAPDSAPAGPLQHHDD